MQELPVTLLAATRHILRPLVRVLLRYGVTHTAFAELAKRVFFDVAQTDYALPGRKQTTSRISTMTGLSRKEVARLATQPEGPPDLDPSRINRAARVITGWTRDERFLNASGAPADLVFEDGSPSFMALVKKYSGDITARTIADELTRIGAISVGANGKLHLESRAYVPTASETDKIILLGTDVADLVETVAYNLTCAEEPRFQRKVAYTGIPAGEVNTLKASLAETAQATLEDMDRKLASVSSQLSTEQRDKKTTRIGFGIYYFEEEES